MEWPKCINCILHFESETEFDQSGYMYVLVRFCTTRISTNLNYEIGGLVKFRYERFFVGLRTRVIIRVLILFSDLPKDV